MIRSQPVAQGSKPNRFSLDLLSGVLARRAEPFCRHDVHRASEEVLKCTLQGGLLERARRLAKVDEQIEIAVAPRLATSHRPEYPHAGRAVTRQDLLDLFAAPAQLFKAGRWPGRTRVRIRATAALDFTTELAEPA